MTTPIQCTYIGHATTLIRIGGTTIITDPHLGRRVFVKRQTPLAVDFATLGHVGAVLVSHMHYDHCNIGSYKYFSSAVPVIVPENTEPVIGRHIANPIIELAHFATHTLTDGTEIIAVPILHRGGRLSQLRYTASNGYLVKKDGATVFFCGDSAYGGHFKELSSLYQIDLALLPIGGYEPRFIMRERHMTPAEAITAFEDTGAKSMVPIHFGTFRLSMENPEAPEKWLRTILEERPELKERVHILAVGETYTSPT